MKTLVVVSDVHYAGPTEMARKGFEARSIQNPFQRALAQTYRGLVWMRDPLAHNGQFDKFLAAAGDPDLVVGNGDYSVDSAFVGLADDGVFETVAWCLDELRGRHGERFHSTIGDHELGKMNLLGGAGGLRLESYRRATERLGLKRFWTIEVGSYLLVGVTSTLVALPIYAPEILPEERRGWEELRAAHLEEVRRAFASLRPAQRVLLFAHDPTALPFLAQVDEVRRHLDQVERTIVGHLHSNCILRQGEMLAGMPNITFLGNSIRRYSAALRRARDWKPFHLLLCPSVSGIQWRKDGGFLRIELEEEARQPLNVTLHPLPWD
ncbi:MAG: metallophosphoesterase [Verrucomicrobia bacterium]|nr:metallophosphoesterase [Verrucomicrobiota bacterium]